MVRYPSEPSSPKHKAIARCWICSFNLWCRWLFEFQTLRVLVLSSCVVFIPHFGCKWRFIEWTVTWWKCPICLTFDFFGSRMCWSLMCLEMVEHSHEVLFNDILTFSEEYALKPSVTGALSLGIDRIVSLISSYENCISREDRSCCWYPRETQLKVCSMFVEVPRCCWKWSTITFSLSSCSNTDPLLVHRHWMWSFLTLEFAQSEVNFVLVSFHSPQWI